MINAWKKFITKENPTNGKETVNDVVPQGVEKLNKTLQQKFRNGVSYNLRVPIIGDTRVGKSSLFRRLKGEQFSSDYIPTDDLKVTSIDWNYRNRNDIVKIDVWEVVQTCVKQNNPAISDLKTDSRLASDDQQPSMKPKPTFIKTSDNIDIFKGAHAVIMMFDLQKTWTYKYIQSEIVKVPKELPILVLGNFRDMSHHRTVTPEQVLTLVKSLDRSSCDGHTMYMECSMKNGFGVKLIEKFFNIPFLKLQEATLLKQLELNRQETMTTLEELEILQDTSNEEYERFLASETIRRRQIADAMSPVNSGITNLEESAREVIRKSAISSEFNEKQINVTSIESINHDKKTDAQLTAEAKFKNDRMPSIVFGAKNPLPESKKIQNSFVITSHQSTSPDTGDIVSGLTHVQITNKESSKDSSLEQASKSACSKDSDSCNSDDGDDMKDNPLIANFGTELDSDDLSS